MDPLVALGLVQMFFATVEDGPAGAAGSLVKMALPGGDLLDIMGSGSDRSGTSGGSEGGAPASRSRTRMASQPSVHAPRSLGVRR
jgi:hypothetical protein